MTGKTESVETTLANTQQKTPTSVGLYHHLVYEDLAWRVACQARFFRARTESLFCALCQRLVWPLVGLPV
ncbi:hypothetical protein RSSM_05711 [Rhodopirellula sallentina SM41]|uniref:Uncharacterized protein n=1 Tax=Rhodopirellula sallentina SM41 TaxID=1263870 RepID=M5U4R3_9BACT|nr:hypothetical protein RSSM_05711 [Rhodopirellula sallentina SM41]